MALQLYNWLSRTKEIFKPLRPGFAGMYVCGPTVYGDAHAGHAKAYITYDILHRYLKFAGYKVRYVQNITDVGHLTDNADAGDDPVETKARFGRVEPMEIAEHYTRGFFRDLAALNNLLPHISPRASGHIPEQLELAEQLIRKGYAYQSGGSVFFSVAAWPGYGRLSGKKVDELTAAVRIAADTGKKDLRDFAVWRAAKPGQIMRWRSPWGEGIPGWHAECTVMAKKYLGLPFDIHGGGLENIFPHNESEMAQCEAAYGSKYARYWVLNNMVTVDGTKMGKSLGNFTTIAEIIRQYSPMILRFFILSSHYRSNTDFSARALTAAAAGYGKLLATLQNLRQLTAGPAAGETAAAVWEELAGAVQKRFIRAIEDDLNTPAALAELFSLSREINRLLSAGQPPSSSSREKVLRVYLQLGSGILGLFAEEQASPAGHPGLADNLINVLVELRAGARLGGDWDQADLIRRKLAGLGILLEDRGDGTTDWRQTAIKAKDLPDSQG